MPYSGKKEKKIEFTDEEKKLLKQLVEHYDEEDREIREKQIRTWRKLKLYWEGFTNIWYSEIAHDWRIWDNSQTEDNEQAAYDKKINVFRAYLESIIAALSVVVPPVKCYPEDADNPLDLLTARTGDKVSKLIYRHNDVQLLWLHSLFVYCTEGMVACYTYSKQDEQFGTYTVPKEEESVETHKFTTCTACGEDFDEVPFSEEEILAEQELAMQPQIDESGFPIIDEMGQPVMQEKPPEEPEVCPLCGEEMSPVTRVEPTTVKKIVGEEQIPKSRQCIEAYGGLYIKVANYAKKQADTPYLMFSYETDFTFARERYEDLSDKIGPGISGSSYESYERWGRSNPQYAGDLPRNNVTVRNCWFRPSAYHIFNKDEVKLLKEKFPKGTKVVMIDDNFAEAENQALDDYWTLTHNPLSDHLYHDPIGLLLVSIQDITDDIISLVLQTIEHGIPQTMADPRVLNFEAYRKMEATPGSIISATPVSGKAMGDGFYEVKTATLSPEILPFGNKIQELGQLASGAAPTIFGGQLEGSKTASEYSMSRAQALQRLQNTWKVFTIWWKQIFEKAIPGYIALVQEDEKFVEKDEFGNFVNVFIRKAELEGKIGKIELEANENLPITWAQKKDVIMQLLQANNPEILAMLAQPENLPLIYEAIGIDDFHVLGEDDRIKQNDEIKELLVSEPIVRPPSPEEQLMSIDQGMEPQEVEEPSIDIDETLDNHQIEFATCRKFLISEAGRQAKVENPNGYKNVLLHALRHNMILQQQMMAQQQAEMEQENSGDGRPKPVKSSKKDMSSPNKGEENVVA